MIKVNGKVYNVSGNNVSVVNGVVKVDGKVIDESMKNSVMQIEITGELMSLQTDASVSCQNVQGDVKAGGSVNCDDVRGNVMAGGSVNCDDIGGNLTAGGSVNRS